VISLHGAPGTLVTRLIRFLAQIIRHVCARQQMASPFNVGGKICYLQA
jgi:hypothetical protein